MPEAQTFISAEQSRSTMHRPDCDYVEGQALERSRADGDHRSMKSAVGSYFFVRRKQWDVTVPTEMRVPVKPGRFRVPYLCMVPSQSYEQILIKPPFLAIEILSPEDRWSGHQGRIKDFPEMGVPYVWVLDRHAKTAFIETPADGLGQAKDGILRTQNPAFEVPLSGFFS